jgi:hypothetical protein
MTYSHDHSGWEAKNRHMQFKLILSGLIWASTSPFSESVALVARLT